MVSLILITCVLNKTPTEESSVVLAPGRSTLLASGRSCCYLVCVLACNPSAPHTHAHELSFHQDTSRTPDMLPPCPTTPPHPNPIPIRSPCPCRSTPTPSCPPTMASKHATCHVHHLAAPYFSMAPDSQNNLKHVQYETRVQHTSQRNETCRICTCNICETHMQHPKKEHLQLETSYCNMPLKIIATYTTSSDLLLQHPYNSTSTYL